jgi:hypothetical protein
MATPDELRAELAAGRAALKEAVAGAKARWETPLAESDWSPRRAAEHAASADVYFASEVCGACGYPGLDRWEASYADAGAALEGIDAAAAKADGRLKYVTDKDLEMVHEKIGPVSAVIKMATDHLHEHAEQIKNG